MLKEKLDAVLARGGVQAPTGVSPLRSWILACEAQQSATCSQGNRAFETNTVATLRTDLQGRAELGTLSAGTCYVYAGNQRYQQRNVLWIVRVDVRNGANNAVKLIKPISRQSTDPPDERSVVDAKCLLRYATDTSPVLEP